MILCEPDSERKHREEKADHLRRLNRGRRVYIDQFATPYNKEQLVGAALATLKRLPKCLEDKNES